MKSSQVAALLNQHYKIHWPSLSNTLGAESLDLTSLDLFLWNIIKKMSYRDKVHTKQEHLHWIMDVVSYI
jgi:hypothetical protein